jgi:hypothetical protein
MSWGEPPIRKIVILLERWLTKDRSNLDKGAVGGHRLTHYCYSR